MFHEPLAMPEEEWRRCFAVDLDGVWHSCRAVLPTMLAQGAGSIVAIASCHSFAIIPHTFPYPVAKHGLLGLVRALGIEYAAKGVRVNAIAPGYIETQIATDYWNTFPDPQAERRKACDLHPPKRVGRPEEVAMTAVFLASDEAPVHQRRLHHDRWRALGALPRLTAPAREARPCGFCSGPSPA